MIKFYKLETRCDLLIVSYILIPGKRLRNYQIDVSSEKPSVEQANVIYSSSDVAPEVIDVPLDDEQTGRYVRIRMAEKEVLTICELEVYG